MVGFLLLSFGRQEQRELSRSVIRKSFTLDTTFGVKRTPMGICNTANSNVTFMIMQLHLCLGMKIAISCLLGSNIRSQEVYFADTRLGSSYLKINEFYRHQDFFKKNKIYPWQGDFELIPSHFGLRFQVIFLLEKQNNSVMRALQIIWQCKLFKSLKALSLH